MAKISIIVPIYNTQKYLKNCIESVLNQTFKDFELILVDDGSTDNSGAICDQYSGNDRRITVIHKKCEGPGSARNSGIEMAHGEFIGFIDGDDYIESNMYESLYNDVIEYDADVSICGIYNVFKDKKIRQSDIDGKMLMGPQDAIRHVLESKLFSVNAVNKLFKRDLFKDIRFPVGKTAEDAFVIPTIFKISKKIIFNSKPLYNYVRRENSITTSKFSEDDLDVIEAYNLNLSMVRLNFPKLEKQAQFRLIWSYIYILDKMLFSEDYKKIKEYEEISKIIKDKTWEIIKNPYFSLKRKICALIFFISKDLYVVIRKKYFSKNFKIMG